MTQANPCVALLAVPCRGHGPICKECWTLISVDASEVIKRKYNMQNPDDMYCVKHKCWSGLRKYGPARDKAKCNKRYEEDGAADVEASGHTTLSKLPDTLLDRPINRTIC